MLRPPRVKLSRSADAYNKNIQMTIGCDRYCMSTCHCLQRHTKNNNVASKQVNKDDVQNIGSRKRKEDSQAQGFSSLIV